MCYAWPVMLRGRCSCAISGRPGASSGTQTTRPTPLLRVAKSRKSFVSPTSKKFARKSFVSPTYAKTGGWGVLTSASRAIVGAPTFPFLPARRRRLQTQEFSGEREIPRPARDDETEKVNRRACEGNCKYSVISYKFGRRESRTPRKGRGGSGPGARKDRSRLPRQPRQ